MIAMQEPSLADKVAFLSRPEAYSHPTDGFVRKETHMSWVFLAGDRVYKLKKPVRFPYLDFSTLPRRVQPQSSPCPRRLYLRRAPCRLPAGAVAGRGGQHGRLAGRHASAR
jgi:aminoglycoside phosphotransferase family enzyme